MQTTHRVFAARVGPAARKDDRAVAHAIAQAKLGNMSAWRYLYVTFEGDLYRYVNSIVRNPADAEDITQSLFLKLMKAIAKYEPRQVPFRAWLMRVARNAALDHARSRRVVPSDEVHPSDNSRSESRFESLFALREALGTLTAAQREVVVLRHVAGLSPPEIATLLGRSEGSVRSLHHRGRGAMQSALRDRGAAPVTAGG
jgi:RNA polymerase sigma-70 factor, ECF subfamily